MYCNSCGKSIQGDTNICTGCGARVRSINARKHLVRSVDGGKISGVCLALANYLEVDVTLVRAVWLFAALIPPGVGLIAYLVGWIVIPLESHATAQQRVEQHASDL